MSDEPPTSGTPQGFVENLSCAEDTAGVADVIQYLDDAMESLTGSSLNDLESEEDDAISIGDWIKDSLTEAIEENIPDHIDILVPQKVCSGLGDNLPTRGVSSCAKLDMVSLNESVAYFSLLFFILRTHSYNCIYYSS